MVTAEFERALYYSLRVSKRMWLPSSDCAPPREARVQTAGSVLAQFLVEGLEVDVNTCLVRYSNNLRQHRTDTKKCRLEPAKEIGVVA